MVQQPRQPGWAWVGAPGDARPVSTSHQGAGVGKPRSTEARAPQGGARVRRSPRPPLSLSVPSQVVQPDLEEAGGLQGAGEGAHLRGDRGQDAGEGSPWRRPGALRVCVLRGDKRGPSPVQTPPPSPLLGEGRACADLCCGPKTCSLLLSPSPEPYPRPNALCSQALVPSVPRASEAPLLPLSKRRVLRGRDPSPQCPLRPAALEEGSC